MAGLIDAAGAAPTLLIAHDWGGIIGWLFALTGRRPLKQFIVMNLPHPAFSFNKLIKWPQILKSWYVFFFQIPRLPELILGTVTSFRSPSMALRDESILSARNFGV